jgi:hypothetical protein
MADDVDAISHDLMARLIDRVRPEAEHAEAMLSLVDPAAPAFVRMGLVAWTLRHAGPVWLPVLGRPRLSDGELPRLPDRLLLALVAARAADGTRATDDARLDLGALRRMGRL